MCQIICNTPYVLLANHIEDKDIILIYSVAKLERVASEMKSRGWKEEKRLDIPPGPCDTFRDPDGNYIARFENQNFGINTKFNGRIDLK